MSPPPLLSCQDLCVTLGGQLILDGVTADIPRGQMTALIGLNGSGKSTLLRTILGEYPYQGKLLFRCGHDHTRPTPQHIGYVPQRLNIDPRLPLTVRDFLGLALKKTPIFLGLGAKWERRFREVLRPVDAEHLLEVPVEGLSGGQLQRVLLALAMEPQPELLLLDEPASGIDFQSQQGFYQLIQRLNRETGVTVVLVSHDLSVVAECADQVLCLRDGRIVCHGPPQEMLSPANLSSVFGPSTSLLLNHRH